MKWVSKGKKKYSFKRSLHGFVYAIHGIFSAFKTETNLLIELIFGIITLFLGIFLKLNSIEFCIVIICIGLVLSLEIVNTAIEYTVDMAMPEVHPLAKIAKDAAAGSVLLASFCTFVVGIIIYLPKVIELFK